MSNKKRTTAPVKQPKLPFESEQDGTDSALLPWSYRHGRVLGMTVTAVSAVCAVLVGTFVYRVGLRQNVPVGLLIALMLVALSSWSARARTGTWGLVLHFVISACVLTVMGDDNGGRIYLLVRSAQVFPTWIMNNAVYIWMFGMVAIQLVIMFLPHRFFVIPPREVAPDDEADGAQHEGRKRGAHTATDATAEEPQDAADGERFQKQDADTNVDADATKDRA